MTRLATWLLALACGLGAGSPAAAAQDVAPPPPLARTAVTTVLIDAVVTDASGRRVETLGTGDFIVTLEGRPQRVTLVRYVASRAAARAAAGSASHRPRGGAPVAVAVPLPEAGLDPGVTAGPATSTLGFVVDDVGLAPVDVQRARTVIERETARLHPADIVITRFTSAAPRARDGHWPLIATLTAILDAWNGTPGRKGLVIFSAGIVAKAAIAPGAVRLPDAAVMAALRGVTVAAARADTVLYAVNVPRFDAWVASRHAILDSPYDRAAEGPGYLAHETGGFFFKNPGDLALATARAVADQHGYYLLGVETDDASGSPGARARLDVRAQLAGVHVRARRTLSSRRPD